MSGTRKLGNGGSEFSHRVNGPHLPIIEIPPAGTYGITVEVSAFPVETVCLVDRGTRRSRSLVPCESRRCRAEYVRNMSNCPGELRECHNCCMFRRYRTWLLAHSAPRTSVGTNITSISELIQPFPRSVYAEIDENC